MNLDYIKAYKNNMDVLQHESKKDIKGAFLAGVFNDNTLYSEQLSYNSSMDIIICGDEYIHGYFLQYSDFKNVHILDFFKCKVYHGAARFDEGLETYFKYNGAKYYINDFFIRGNIGNILNSYKLENKITLTNLKNITAADAAQLEPNDPDAVRELTLFIENDGAVYDKFKQFKLNTIDKHVKNDTFIYGAALQGLKHIIDQYIQNNYILNYCRRGDRVKDLLNVNDRVYIYDYFLIKLLGKNFN